MQKMNNAAATKEDSMKVFGFHILKGFLIFVAMLIIAIPLYVLVFGTYYYFILIPSYAEMLKENQQAIIEMHQSNEESMQSIIDEIEAEIAEAAFIE